MNNAFKIYNISLPDDINDLILIKLKNQLRFDCELSKYNKQIIEIKKINEINNKRRRFAQTRVGLDPDNDDIPQMPYRHLRKPIILNIPVLEK